MSEPSDRLHGHDERYVWYALSGDFVPDDISAATGLDPSSTKRKGDRANERTTYRLPASSWVVDSGLSPSVEFHEHLDDLFVRLRSGWQALSELGRIHQAWVTAAIYCREAQGPLVQINPEAAASIAELGATLGFDIYALSEREWDDDTAVRPLTRTELRDLNETLADQETDQPPP